MAATAARISSHVSPEDVTSERVCWATGSTVAEGSGMGETTAVSLDRAVCAMELSDVGAAAADTELISS